VIAKSRDWEKGGKGEGENGGRKEQSAGISSLEGSVVG
jgi:hypothetical protein